MAKYKVEIKRIDSSESFENGIIYEGDSFLEASFFAKLNSENLQELNENINWKSKRIITLHKSDKKESE